MPFGLRTAPATFQKITNVVQSGSMGTGWSVILDDIVIYANSLMGHGAKFGAVFGRLRKYNLS
jgi:hypothetical protein